MKRTCGLCGKKGHNSRTCKNKETIDDVIVNKGSKIYIPKKLKEGDSILKSKLLKRFNDNHNHKRWNGKGWSKVTLNNKLRDNKYKIINVIEKDHDFKKKNILTIHYTMESKRDIMKWVEIKSSSHYTLTTPVILYK